MEDVNISTARYALPADLQALEPLRELLASCWPCSRPWRTTGFDPAIDDPPVLKERTVQGERSSTSIASQRSELAEAWPGRLVTPNEHT
jgi:hypothetical protein